MVGQVGRLIVAGPGSALGRYPVGNTGRANVSAFEPMPIRADLVSMLDDADDPEPGADSRHEREKEVASRFRAVMDNAALYKLTGWVGGVGLKAYARRRKPLADPATAQERQLLKLVNAAKNTTFGHDHDFAEISSVADYQRRVPIRTFEDFWADYWSEPFPRLENVTWPGTIRYFARSSGTTTGESKHIPCSDDMITANNRGGLEVVLAHLQNNPNSRVSAGRTFLFGGSPALDELAPGIFAGELSGIAARETPSWAGNDRYYPPPDLAAITDWGEKVERFAADCVGKNIRAISVVPTWLQVLFDRAFEIADCEDRRLVSLFPDLELITHGGINFAPYAEAFNELLAGSHAELREVCAASEGFIAVADRDPGQGMKILLDNGLFFEFISRPAPPQEPDALLDRRCSARHRPRAARDELRRPLVLRPRRSRPIRRRRHTTHSGRRQGLANPVDLRRTHHRRTTRHRSRNSSPTPPTPRQRLRRRPNLQRPALSRPPPIRHRNHPRTGRRPRCRHR